MDENNVLFGAETQKEVQELAKALEVGYSMGTTDQAGFGATRLESLDKTLKIAVAEEKSIKFWKALAKSKADSTVEEFTTVNAMGDANFYNEGGIPEEYDEELKREFELVKYIGAVGKIPNVAMTVKSQTDNKALVQKLKAMAILRKCNLKAFFGSADYNSVEWNGFLTQFLARVKRPSENIIDMRGKCLNPEILTNITKVIQDNWGDPNNVKGWMSNTSFNHYAKYLIKNKTFMIGANEIRSIVDVPKTFQVGDGSGELETDIWLKWKGQTYLDELHPKLNSAKTAFASMNAKAPVTLNSGTATATVEALSGSNLTAGTYDYVIIPGNKYGVGAGFEIKSVVVASDKKVTFALSDNGSPTGQEATFFEIYRKLSSKTALTDYQYLKTVKASATTKVDDGEDIPGTEYAFFWDWNFDQVLNFRQLLPMVSMPLAVVDDSIRWLQKLYGTPILFNPNRMVVVKNVGTDLT